MVGLYARGATSNNPRFNSVTTNLQDASLGLPVRKDKGKISEQDDRETTTPVPKEKQSGKADKSGPEIKESISDAPTPIVPEAAPQDNGASTLLVTPKMGGGGFRHFAPDMEKSSRSLTKCFPDAF